MKKPSQTYLETLNDLYEVVDRARMRVHELQGHERALGHEDPMQMQVSLNKSLEVEATRMASALVGCAGIIDKLQFKEDD